MTSISISIITILSFIVFAMCGAAIFKFITGKRNKYENDSLRRREQDNDMLIKKSLCTIADLESEIKTLKQEKEDLQLSQTRSKADGLMKEAEYIKQTQIEKQQAYEKGRLEALKEYKITCQQFFYYRDGFFKHHAKSGYKLQLFVNGIPVFDPIETIIHEVEQFDENIKKTIIDATTQAIAIAGNQLGGISFERLPLIETKE